MKKFMGIRNMSFSKKIKIALIFSFMPIILFSILYLIHSRYIVVESMKNESLKIIKNVQKIYIEKYINDVEKDLNLLYEQIQYGDLNDEKIMQNHMKEWERYWKYNTNIDYIYVGTKDKETYVYPYWENKDGYYDPTKRLWYKEGLHSNKIQWVSYRDYRSKKRSVSASKSIKDNKGNIVGVLGMDTTLDNLSASVSKVDLGEDAYVMIVNQQGNIIAHKDKNQLWESVKNNQWYKALKKENYGVFYNKQKKYFISFSTINKNGWKIIGIIPDKYLEELLKPVGLYASVIILISSLLFFIVGNLIIRKLKSENKNICDIIEAIENKDLDMLKIDHYEKGEYGEIYKKLNRAMKMINRIKNDAIYDKLTGAYNRRYFDQVLEELIHKSENFTLMMIDVDDFKKVNDTYGHQKGDFVLKEIAESILKSIREKDILARYGGEEFVIIFPKLESKDVYNITNRIREKIENIKWQENWMKITISAGVSVYNRQTKEKLINEADQLLYKAKSLGKNKVIF
ncbi:sensor domain-containing diguanylate cyclase [Crassaminicella profunda]|uniref:sensor domain-containing diguanylate cyclase n=1 Tax=Crassaminicella profunda TaxID=1286698 RepID=UPI001CA7AEB9|nr:sensor domain-containing diguanylate cyclase [Crassaminicella profunda]QZY57284.1 diguanylate cyclase [Crassaminicella profunda]